jgi:hypothetical protein
LCSKSGCHDTRASLLTCQKENAVDGHALSQRHVDFVVYAYMIILYHIIHNFVTYAYHPVA